MLDHATFGQFWGLIDDNWLFPDFWREDWLYQYSTTIFVGGPFWGEDNCTKRPTTMTHSIGNVLLFTCKDGDKNQSWTNKWVESMVIYRETTWTTVIRTFTAGCRQTSAIFRTRTPADPEQITPAEPGAPDMPRSSNNRALGMQVSNITVKSLKCHFHQISKNHPRHSVWFTGGWNGDMATPFSDAEAQGELAP